MTRDEVIEVLCKLTEEVANRHLGFSEPSDCICEARRLARGPEYFRHAGKTVAFIVEVTRKALSDIEEKKKAEENGF